MARVRKPPDRNRRAGIELLTCFKCEAWERTAWSMLGPDGRRQLSRTKAAQVYSPRQIVFQQGSPCLGVYCVASGVLTVKRIGPLGTWHITRLCQAGDTMGHRAYFTNSRFDETAEAESESTVCFIHAKVVQDLIRHSPDLGLHFVRRLAVELSELEERMIAHRSLSVAARLAYLLLDFKDRYDGTDEQGNIIFTLPFSRLELADLVGARPESVSRAIRQLEKAGAVRISNRKVVLPDLDVLMDEIAPRANDS